jgi:Mor family transcriptional regulator
MNDAELKLISNNLTGTQRRIADVIGLKKYIELVKLINGDTVYIPKYNELLKPCLDEKIRCAFDGHNYKELADEYGLTVRTIYDKIPAAIRKDRRCRPLEGQIPLTSPKELLI